MKEYIRVVGNAIPDTARGRNSSRQHSAAGGRPRPTVPDRGRPELPFPPERTAPPGEPSAANVVGAKRKDCPYRSAGCGKRPSSIPDSATEAEADRDTDDAKGAGAIASQAVTPRTPGA